MLHLLQQEDVEIKFGEPTKESGKYAVLVPFYNGAFSGKIARINVVGSSFSDLQELDLAQVNDCQPYCYNNEIDSTYFIHSEGENKEILQNASEVAKKIIDIIFLDKLYKGETINVIKLNQSSNTTGSR